MLINLLVGFFVGLSSGATVIISQFYGAQNEDRVGEAVHTAMAFSLVCGLGMTVIGLLFRPDSPGSDGHAGVRLWIILSYLNIYFIGNHHEPDL